jgi:hypothetical protein
LHRPIKEYVGPLQIGQAQFEENLIVFSANSLPLFYLIILLFSKDLIILASFFNT